MDRQNSTRNIIKNENQKKKNEHISFNKVPGGRTDSRLLCPATLSCKICSFSILAYFFFVFYHITDAFFDMFLSTRSYPRPNHNAQRLHAHICLTLSGVVRVNDNCAPRFRLLLSKIKQRCVCCNIQYHLHYQGHLLLYLRFFKLMNYFTMLKRHVF